MPDDLAPLHEHLTFLSPLSEQRADALVRWLADGLSGGGTVLDVGCGWGELLLRVVAAAPLAHGVGIDLDAERIAEATRRAAERGLQARTTFTAEDASTAAPPQVDALVAIGASQVWGAGVEEHGPLDYGAALPAMRAAVPAGAKVLYGEAIWSRSPTPEATAPLSGRDDEFVPLPRLVALALEHGFEVEATEETDLEEWDAFEGGFVAGREEWLAAHDDDHPEAAGIRERVAAQRAAYHQGYRGVLGLAYLRLVAR